MASWPSPSSTAEASGTDAAFIKIFEPRPKFRKDCLIVGEAGNDTILRCSENAVVFGGAGNHSISGGSNDTISHGGGADVLHGGAKLHSGGSSDVAKIMAGPMPVEPAVPTS